MRHYYIWLTFFRVCREIREGYICYLWMWRIRISEGGDDDAEDEDDGDDDGDE